MTETRRVEIAGGGLAGLSLGLALQRRGIPVTLFEAGDYPRHRVCGEFITGLDTRTTETLGLSEVLGDARRHTTTAWFHQGHPAGVTVLPKPALGLSRHLLDQRLVHAFRSAGGEVRTRTRVPLDPITPGRVIAAGRDRGRSSWIGLKIHVASMPLAADLELHLGDGAYVGACGIEDSQVNVCGLFRTRAGLEPSPASSILGTYLRSAGLGELADRVEAAQPDLASASAVAALTFTAPVDHPGRLAIGDAYALIPPFTGHGMAIAFTSAAIALDPLEAWSRGQLDWDAATRLTQRRLRRRLRVRFTVARQLHRFLWQGPNQRWLVGAFRARLLPFRLLYRLLH